MEYQKPKGGEMLLKREIDTARVQLKTTRKPPNITLSSPQSVADYIREMQDYDRERFKVLYLDIRNRLLGVENVAEGTINASLIHPREVIKGSLLANASGVILAHNHPSGIPDPSREDIEITSKLYQAFKLMGIDVIDAIVIGQEGYYSFSEKGLLSTLESGGSRIMERKGNDACTTAMQAAMSVIEEQCGTGQEIDIEGVKIKIAPPEEVVQVMAEELTYDQRVQAIQESSWAQNEAAGLCTKLFGVSPEDEGYAGCIQKVSRKLAEGVVRKG